MTEQDIVKCAQLDMLKELDRICNKSGIPYFLVGGSLIGAIRHNGFIPWDDDIDVGMCRDDYENFIIACKNNLCSDFALYDWDIDKASPAPFLKMKIKGTHYKEAMSIDTKVNDEIFIDIFPLDNAPESCIKQFIHGAISLLLKKIILLKGGFNIDGGILFKKLIYIPLRCVASLTKMDQWKSFFVANAQRYRYEDTSFAVNICGTYSYKRELKDKKYFKNLISHQFETISVSIPSEYDIYLKEVYGDYMQMPPEAQRISRHAILHVDLGGYKPKSKLSNEDNNG